MEHNEDKYPDQIFKRNHFTEFEDLLFTKTLASQLQKRVKELEFELGAFKAENDEIKEKRTQQQKLTEEERLSIKMDETCIMLKKEITALYTQIKYLTKANSELIIELLKLRDEIKPGNNQTSMSL